MLYRLKKNIHCIDIQGDIALLYYFGNRYVIKGSFVQNILDKFIILLKTPHTLEQISEELSDYSDGEITEALNTFMQYGLLEQIDSTKINKIDFSQTNSLTYFLNYFIDFHSSLSTLDVLHKSKILIVDFVGLGELIAGKLLNNYLNTEVIKYDCLEALEKYFENNLKHLRENVIIISCSWMNAREVQKVNSLFLKLDIKWLLVVQDYFGGTIGPMFGIKDGPCFNCLMKRKYSNMPHIDKYLKIEEYFESTELDKVPILSMQEGLADKVGMEILKIMTNIVYPKTYRGLYEFDILNHRSDYHEVLATPFCEVCSRVQKTPPISITSEV